MRFEINGLAMVAEIGPSSAAQNGASCLRSCTIAAHPEPGRRRRFLGSFVTLAGRRFAMASIPSIDELAARLEEVFASSPAADLQKNLRAVLASVFSRLDLVTREEFDVASSVLARTREKLEALERRVAELEARMPPGGDAPR